jgi:hypothetical protein
MSEEAVGRLLRKSDETSSGACKTLRISGVASNFIGRMKYDTIARSRKSFSPSFSFHQDGN